MQANNQAQGTQKGLAIQIQESSGTIMNSKFLNLSSMTGPAIYSFDLPNSAKS